MTEHIGKLFKAGNEKAKSGSDVFRIGIREGGKDYEYTLFDTDMIAKVKDAFEKDQPVKLIASKPGKYWNLDSIETVTEEAVAKVIDERDKHIAEQVAAKIVAELWIADKIDQSHYLARALVIWCELKLGIDPNVPGRQEENAPLKEEKTQPPDEPSLSPEDIDMSPIPNLGQFYMRCRKYFPALKTSIDILGKLGCKDAIELGALDEAWRKFVDKMSNDPEGS